MSANGFDVEIDTSEVEREWAEALSVLARGINTGVERGVTDGAAQARSSHPYQDHSHALTSSIRGYLERGAVGEAVGVIEAGAKHASFVESGTAAHDIYPKAGNGTMGPLRKGQSRRSKTDVGTHRVALRWESNGEIHFAAMVHHPGSRPMPFLGPAVQKAERVIEVEVELAAERVRQIMER
jgi:hypothetical protein